MRIGNKGIESPWHSTIHWTNLYKVNPAQTGNPNRVLRLAQQQACIEMLSCEIAIKRPEAVVFLSGWEAWAKLFVEGMKTEDLLLRAGSILEAQGELVSDSHHIPFVVVPHPRANLQMPFPTQLRMAFCKTCLRAKAAE